MTMSDRDYRAEEQMDSLDRGQQRETRYIRMSAYERTKAQVYATGNKWAIENFHATHD